MNAGLTSTGVALILVLWKILKTASGKKFVSNCCGRKGEIGFKIQEMNQSPIVVSVHENPMLKEATILHPPV